MLALERKVHSCTKCKQKQCLKQVLRYPPVYSFGDPSGKDFIVVGQNPSDKEYENRNLSKSHSVAERRKSQLTYFERESIHPFFNEITSFFEAEVKKRMNWIDSPWEKVGYLDLVKCPTRLRKRNRNVGQWSKIGVERQQLLIKNCEVFLKRQLATYKPKIILAYGADVGKWFEKYLDLKCEKFEDTETRLNKRDVRLLFVPQRQGPHSKPELFWIRNKILSMIG
jgi:hypothetical protein